MRGFLLVRKYFRYVNYLGKALMYMSQTPIGFAGPYAVSSATFRTPNTIGDWSTDDNGGCIDIPIDYDMTPVRHSESEGEYWERLGGPHIQEKKRVLL